MTQYFGPGPPKIKYRKAEPGSLVVCLCCGQKIPEHHTYVSFIADFGNWVAACVKCVATREIKELQPQQDTTINKIVVV